MRGGDECQKLGIDLAHVIEHDRLGKGRGERLCRLNPFDPRYRSAEICKQPQLLG